MKKQSSSAKKEQIKKEIWSIEQIALEAKQCIAYSYYFYQPKTNDETEYINTSQHLRYLRIIIYKMAIIELVKLFSFSKTNDKYNLIGFIRKLKHDGHYGNFQISNEKILEWETLISQNKSAIICITNLRDKVYAHTDSNKERYLNGDITFDQTNKLIEIAESIIQEIYIKIFDSEVDFSSPIFDRDRFEIVEVLSRAWKDKLKVYDDYFEHRRNG